MSEATGGPLPWRWCSDPPLLQSNRVPRRRVSVELRLVRVHRRARGGINRTEGRDLAFVIATNLAIVTDEDAGDCRQHKHPGLASLDGPADLHNKNRPRAGRDSYERAIDGIRRARTIVGRDRVSALMTTTRESLGRVEDIIDEYMRQGFAGIFLRPLSPYGFAVKTKSYAATIPTRGSTSIFGDTLHTRTNRAGYRFASTTRASSSEDAHAIRYGLRRPSEPGRHRHGALIYN